MLLLLPAAATAAAFFSDNKRKQRMYIPCCGQENATMRHDIFQYFSVKKFASGIIALWRRLQIPYFIFVFLLDEAMGPKPPNDGIPN